MCHTNGDMGLNSVLWAAITYWRMKRAAAQEAEAAAAVAAAVQEGAAAAAQAALDAAHGFSLANAVSAWFR